MDGAAAQDLSVSNSDGRRYWTVFVLAVVYGLNFLDRQLLSILAEPVKESLQLSDTQLGTLTGLTFALFYTVFGIPLAIVADRWNRVRLVAIACACWSVFTAGSGLATNFLQLAVARMGVGVGEAGCSPPSYSILSDYFPAEKRGRALALYSLGIPAGSLIGAAFGASVAAHYGWRAAFIAVGLVGLLLAPLLPLLVREPVRGGLDVSRTRQGEDEVHRSALAGVAFFFRSPTLLLSALASGLTAFVSYGLLNWTPAFLGRVQGMTLAQIAAVYSVALAGSLVFAAWLGSIIADRAGAKAPWAYALLPGLGILATVPFLFAFTSAPTWQLSVALLIAPLVLSSTYLVPALALQQNRTPTRYRATASAILLFLLNLIGLGFGPMFVGAVSDHLQPQFGVRALGYALQWLTPFILLAFAFQCATAWRLRKEHRVA